MRKMYATALLLTSCSFAVAQDDSPSMQDLQHCREIADAKQRLECYDRIANMTIASEPAATKDAAPAITEAADEPVAASTAPQEVAAATQGADFGLPKTEDEYVSIEATLVRCNMGNDRRFYFYLDNGQVWRYLGNRKLRYRDCNFPVTLTEDRIGFKLQIEAEPEHRVKRVR